MSDDPFVEKYRPSKIEDVLISDFDRAIFLSYIEKKSIPHLLFQGSPGLGKTTIAKILAREITEDILYINASKETSVDVIRGKVNDFCSTTAFGDYLKVIILDEFDYMSLSAQATMRNVLEEFFEVSRFILTCNYSNKVMDAIKSRCQTFQFKQVEPKTIAKRCIEILNKEKVKCKEVSQVGKLVMKYYPDIRKTINELERNSVNGVFEFNAVNVDVGDILIDLLKQKDWDAIRKNVVGSIDYPELYKVIHDKAGTLNEEKKIDIRLLAGEYLFRHSIIVDPEINFMNCIDQIIKEI
jgi:DNA polymerase III delta prime subunit